MKNEKQITKQEYLRLYPSGSCPVKFCTTAKVHKISENDTVDEVPIRSIVSQTLKLQQTIWKSTYKASVST